LIDPPIASLVSDAIATANEQKLTMVVLQIDSGGAVDVDVDALVRAVDRSRVPIVAWVGPSGAESQGAAAELVVASHAAFVSQGSSIGPATPLRLDQPDDPTAAQVSRRLADLARERDRDPQAAARISTREMSASQAARLGVVNGLRPTLGEVVVTMDGKTVQTAGGSVTLSTAKVIGKGRDRRRQPNQDVVFDSLGLGARVAHTLIDPSVAYFLFAAGLALIVFEFFTISIGLIGVGGALAVAGASYGFSHLPVHWWAVGLLLVAVLGYSIDVQAGGLGPWTAIGTAALVGGSLTLFGGSSELDPAWWLVLLVCVVALLFFVWGMTAAVRARFSTPTVGREGMIGEMGSAEVTVDPDGVVLVRGARWRARTNRATPIAAGDPVRVVAVEGVVLEVEPETGGARDHRERARRSKAGAAEV
jgi:membrane-bound serine protease (ClpP class)